MKTAPHTAALIACIVFAVLSGCGGRSNETESPPAPAVGGASPGATESIYRDVTRALDAAYAELGEPTMSFDNMAKVQRRASEIVSERMTDWPNETSYSISAMSDHVYIFVSCKGEEKKGDWRP